MHRALERDLTWDIVKLIVSHKNVEVNSKNKVSGQVEVNKLLMFNIAYLEYVVII